jgi:limonene-1,2-epoxide hydrolase
MTPSASDAATDTMIREFFGAWERRDADHVASCFTEDGIYHNIPMEPLVGKTAIREFLAQRADVAPPLIEIHHQVVSGDIVRNERTATCPTIPETFEVDAGTVVPWLIFRVHQYSWVWVIWGCR